MLSDCLALDNEEYQLVAGETDKLWLDCFIEGRIPKRWIESMPPQLNASNLYLSRKAFVAIID
jgi:hypothetical protein